MSYSRVRMDALTDGVFAIAMTLLVLEVRIPETVTNPEFAHALGEAVPRLAIYALSFFTLGLSWLGRAQMRTATEEISRGEAMLTLVYLFLVTIAPFSSMLVGRYDEAPLALWFYCANLGAIGLTSAGLRFMLPRADTDDQPSRRIGASLLLAASAIGAAALVPIFRDGHALWALAINVLGPWLDRALRKQAA